MKTRSFFLITLLLLTFSSIAIAKDRKGSIQWKDIKAGKTMSAKGKASKVALHKIYRAGKTWHNVRSFTSAKTPYHVRCRATQKRALQCVISKKGSKTPLAQSRIAKIEVKNGKQIVYVVARSARGAIGQIVTFDMTNTKNRPLVRDIKEKLRYVAEDYDAEMKKSKSSSEAKYESSSPTTIKGSKIDLNP